MRVKFDVEIRRVLLAGARHATDPAWFDAVWPHVRDDDMVGHFLALNRQLPHRIAEELAAYRDEDVRVALCTNPGVSLALRLEVIFAETRLGVLTKILDAIDDVPTKHAIWTAFKKNPTTPLAFALLRSTRSTDPATAAVVVATVLQSGKALTEGDQGRIQGLLFHHNVAVLLDDTARLAITDHGHLLRALQGNDPISATVARHSVEVTLAWAREDWTGRLSTVRTELDRVLRRCVDLTGAREWFTGQVLDGLDVDALLADRDTALPAAMTVPDLREVVTEKTPRLLVALANHPEAAVSDLVVVVDALGAAAGDVLAALDPERRVEVMCAAPKTVLTHHGSFLTGHEAEFVRRTTLDVREPDFVRWLTRNPAGLAAVPWDRLRAALDAHYNDFGLADAVSTLARETLGVDEARWVSFIDLSAGFTASFGELLGLCVSLNA